MMKMNAPNIVKTACNSHRVTASIDLYFITVLPSAKQMQKGRKRTNLAGSVETVSSDALVKRTRTQKTETRTV